MKYQQMRKDITRLIDDVKYHSDALTPIDRLPIIQLNIILSKMNQMMEKTIILKHYVESEMEHSKEYQYTAEAAEVTALMEKVEKKERNESTTIIPETLPPADITTPPDLRLAIGIYERYLFANELFNGSLEAYEESVNAINGFDTLEQAERYIMGQLKKKYNWDMENETVLQFQTLVKRRYTTV
jgi:hypothetical protein